MNYTEQEIKDLITKVLSDLGIEYYEDKPFFIEFQEEQDYFDLKYEIKKPWLCSVPGPDYQFGGDDGGYVFSIDDESPNTIFFQDASGGQVPSSFIKEDEDGKYYQEYILK